MLRVNPACRVSLNPTDIIVDYVGSQSIVTFVMRALTPSSVGRGIQTVESAGQSNPADQVCCSMAHQP